MKSVRPALLFLLLALAPHAPAEPPAWPADPEIAGLLEEALSKNPELAAAREGAAAVRARITQARALPDPMLTLSYQNGGGAPSLGSDDDTFVGITVEQTLPRPSRRNAMRDVAAREAEQADRPLERVRLSLVAELRRAYTDLLLAREYLAILDDEERTWAEIEAATRARYAVGLADQQDVLRAQAERTRLVPMRAHEEGNAIAATAEINRLVGRPSGTPVETPRRLRDIVPAGRIAVPPLEELLALAEDGSPELQAARLGIHRAEHLVALAKSELKPELTAMSGYFNRGSLPPMWMVGLGVQLPVWKKDKQRQAVLAAEATGRQQSALYEAERLQLRVAIEKDYAEWAAAVREAEPYASGVLVQDRLAVESGLASYKTGKLPFVTVLEALGTLYADQRAYAERLAHVLWHPASLLKLMPAESLAPSARGGMETSR